MAKKDGELSGREYLQTIRPEAMGHLLAFYAESGKNLDPKTRFLISVVTKVINFSPRGLRQYIKRSARAGASFDEVVDAILLAYPCAGLTRVVDSIDVLRGMGLHPDAESGTAPERIKVDKSALPAEGGIAKFQAEGIALVLVRHEGRIHAFDAECPHRKGDLSSGKLENGELVCPAHEWRFRLKDGGCSTGDLPLKKHHVVVSADGVEIITGVRSKTD